MDVPSFPRGSGLKINGALPPRSQTNIDEVSLGFDVLEFFGGIESREAITGRVCRSVGGARSTMKKRMSEELSGI